ncbi:MAG: thiol-disulfide oxidoreductase [Novosphingobium sp. 17-62-8]|nr:MAG: thiol-disulfide oxidoreductase [Novosphingobium sp. 17-62-8]
MLAMSAPDPAPLPVTVWYDGACPLCQREIALMRRIGGEGRIDFHDASNPATACPVDRAQALARFHVREGDRLFTGAAAFAAMWRAIPRLRWLGRMARWQPFALLLEGMYRVFLIVRPRLQRLLK